MWKKLLIVLALAPLAGLLWAFISKDDRLFWPDSAHGRIEEMASILRSIEGPARWCYPSQNALNLVNESERSQEKLNECMSSIAPVSEFEEIQQNYHVRRIYRATVNDRICEVTLSTVWRNDRIVGSDCYYGLFNKSDDTGIGLTSDPFG